MGVNPCHVGRLPVQLAAMNMTNINAQLMTIEAARTRKREDIYRAAMLDPHTAAELSIDDTRRNEPPAGVLLSNQFYSPSSPLLSALTRMPTTAPCASASPGLSD